MPEAAGMTQAEQNAAAIEGMRYKDEKLEEMLNLAKGCLRRGSVPGQPSARHLFDRFDAEASASAAARAPVDPGSQAEVAPITPSPPPIPQTPEGLTTEARIAKLRRDIQTLERSTSERRQELDAVNETATKEVLERCRAQDQLRVARSDVQKTRRAIRDAKDMFRIQEKEIQELKQLVAEPTCTTRRASRGAASSKEIPATFGNNGFPPSGAFMTAAEMDLAANNFLFGASNQPLPGGPLTAAELKGVLLHDALPSASEAKIWGHLKSENEKLASVIDAVGELSRQVHSPRSGKPIGIATGGDSQLVTPVLGVRSVEDGPSVGLAGCAMLGMALPKQKVYAQVLQTRPKNYKLFM